MKSVVFERRDSSEKKPVDSMKLWNTRKVWPSRESKHDSSVFAPVVVAGAVDGAGAVVVLRTHVQPDTQPLAS